MLPAVIGANLSNSLAVSHSILLLACSRSRSTLQQWQ